MENNEGKIEQINNINKSILREKSELDKKVLSVSTGLIIFSVTLAQFFKDLDFTDFIVYSWILSTLSIFCHLIAYRFGIVSLTRQKNKIYWNKISKEDMEELLGIKRNWLIVVSQWLDILSELFLFFSIVFLLIFAYYNL